MASLRRLGSLFLAVAFNAFSVWLVASFPARAGDDGGLSNIPSLPPGFRMSPSRRAPNQSADDIEDSLRPLMRERIPRDFGTVIGPGGVVHPMPPPVRRAETPKKKVPTTEERAASIRKALTPQPPLAFARRHTLDELYGKLAGARDEDESKGLAALIGNIWMRSGSDTANLLMQRAQEAIRQKQFSVALEVLDKIVVLQPVWPEGWNKRAAVRFETGDLDGSMADVDHVLKLEPKHFGALQGMAMILERTGLDKRALEVYRHALSIYPHQPDVQETVDKLALKVEGQGI